MSAWWLPLACAAAMLVVGVAAAAAARLAASSLEPALQSSVGAATPLGSTEDRSRWLRRPGIVSKPGGEGAVVRVECIGGHRVLRWLEGEAGEERPGERSA